MGLFGNKWDDYYKQNYNSFDRAYEKKKDKKGAKWSYKSYDVYMIEKINKCKQNNISKIIEKCINETTIGAKIDYELFKNCITKNFIK